MTAGVMTSTVVYSDHLGLTTWEGRQIGERGIFENFLRNVVITRAVGADVDLDDVLRSLATTGVASEFVERVVRAVPHLEPWELGEAFAECALETECGREVHWPWNLVRDRRTPRASLPGADLVGFFREGQMVLLLFGEVKTSSDPRTPPGVMSGGSGMTWQLKQTAQRLDVQRSLLLWLHARCRNTEHQEMFQQAVGRYLESEGTEMLLAGILVRDTAPNRLDLEPRARQMALDLHESTRALFIAWYVPVPLDDWILLWQGEAS